MPKISDEKRASRKAQILDAAWSCFQRQGLHATTMDDIIRASGLSSGAVYGYFSSKDDLILTALTTSLTGLRALVEPIFARDPPLPPDELLREVAAAITGFTARDGFDLKRIALLGWSEAQRNEKLRETMRGLYLAFRDKFDRAAKEWGRLGLIDATTPSADVAKALLAFALGFVVEAAIIGDVEPDAMARGLRALNRPALETGSA